MRKLAIKTRANRIETEHYGYIALIRQDGKTDKTLNDELKFYARSCLKPVQAKVCKDILGTKLDKESLAIAVASHRADENQKAALNKMLLDFSLDEEHLVCGKNSETNEPRFQSRLDHYCSGKHLAMIAANQALASKDSYHLEDSELQTRIKDEILRLGNLDKIETAVDGCNLPTYYLSLVDLAKIFWSSLNEDSYKDLYLNSNKYAHLISAKKRFDQELMLQIPNRFFAKSGAEGMYLVLNLVTKESLIIKILDGEKRIKDIVARQILEEIKWLKKDELKLDNKIYTSSGYAAGEVVGLDVL